jgi:histidyl-tRNA synthetase
MRQAAAMTIERVRGMNDVSPAVHAARQRLADEMLAVVARAGYALMDFPVVESTELFLRKAGEERVQQMYAFRYRNRDLCLRPEFTASVLRSVIPTLPSQSLPLRVAYHGPVFRYERPGQARYRQFTELGIELLGAAGVAADAEVIGMAHGALQAARVPKLRIVLGHVGIVRTYLAGLRLDERVRDWLIWSMERLRPDGQRGERIHPALAALLEDDDAHSAFAAVASPDRDTFLALLREAGISLEGNRRTPEEIADGLIRKVARRSEGNDVRRALAFLRQLVTFRGAPDAVLPALAELIAAEGLDRSGIERLRGVLDLLGAYGIGPERVTLDLGLGRGLHYYTGILFEIYADDSEQLGGGGRYDELATVLGARGQVPAVGFSLGVERVHDASAHRWDTSGTARTVVVGQGERADGHAAAVIANRLRAAGWTVLLDVRERTPNAALRNARALRAEIYAEPASEGAAIRWAPLNGEAERHIPIAEITQSSGDREGSVADE